MKKLILASTALVALAGAAAAEVKISGSAELGLIGGDSISNDVVTADVVTADDATQFHTDVDVSFAMSGEADNGLTFGVSVDLDEAGKLGGTDGDQDYAIFLAYGGAKLTVGDTDGAFDAALQEVALGKGTINDVETSYFGYSGNSGLDGLGDAGREGAGQIATLSYSAASFTGYASVELDDRANNAGDPIYGVGVKYNAELAGLALGVGLGYQTVADANGAVAGDQGVSITGLSVDTTLANGIKAAVNYTSTDVDGAAEKQTYIGVGAAYTMNAITVAGSYGMTDNVGGVKNAENKGFALTGAYDLGGGLVAKAGYADSERKTAAGVKTDLTQWTLGLAMSF